LSDGLIFCSNDSEKNMKTLCDTLSCQQIEFNSEEMPMKILSDFVDKIVEEEVLL